MINVNLQDAVAVLESKFNLLSIPVLLEKGHQLEGSADSVKLVKESIEIAFDVKTKTSRGATHCMKFSRKVCGNEMQNISAPVISKGTTVSYEKAHNLFGHTARR